MKKISILIVYAFLFVQAFAQTPKNLQLLGSYTYTQRLSGCWHYNHTNGSEYALVGAENGISIVDITNPAAPNELFQLPGVNSIWHEIKVLGDYAYAVSEGSDSLNIKNGVQVIDLRWLPDSAPNYFYQGDGAIAGMLTTAHSIAAEGHYIYVNGHNITSLNRGVLIIDVSDPMHLVFTGSVTNRYCHDSFARNNFLYTSDIGDKLFSVYDITNPASPVLLATQLTPGEFNHNAWLNDSSTVLFTTDEKSNAPVGAFDIRDLNNINLLDTFYNGNFTSSEVHNVRVKNDFLINPSYGSQLTIADASHPDNIIEIANYHTGSYLCWDADPFLNSGNIIATDMNSMMLFVFSPSYIRACYLEGNVTDSVTGFSIPGASVQILSAAVTDITDFSGDYKTGYADSGNYVIEFSKTGYQTKQVNASLHNGVLTTLNVQLVPLGAGIRENDLNQLSLFPNPAADELNVSASGEVSAWKISDKLGRIVLKSSSSFKSMNRLRIDLSSVSKGDYTIELKMKEGAVSKSFVKQ